MRARAELATPASVRSLTAAGRWRCGRRRSMTAESTGLIEDADSCGDVDGRCDRSSRRRGVKLLDGCDVHDPPDSEV